jgi:hypothetical protein
VQTISYMENAPYQAEAREIAASGRCTVRFTDPPTRDTFSQPTINKSAPPYLTSSFPNHYFSHPAMAVRPCCSGIADLVSLRVDSLVRHVANFCHLASPPLAPRPDCSASASALAQARHITMRHRRQRRRQPETLASTMDAIARRGRGEHGEEEALGSLGAATELLASLLEIGAEEEAWLNWVHCCCDRDAIYEC